MLQAYSTQTVLSLLLACVPLLAAFVIIARKLFLQESMACLMAICILSFFKDVLLAVSTLSAPGLLLVENVFLLLNFSLILLACKPLVRPQSFQSLVPAAILTTGAVFITYMLLTGLHRPQTGIQFAACLLILSISFFALFKLLQQQQLRILKSPLFWTAAGFFFYHFQFLLIKVGGHVLFGGEPDFQFYSWLFMLLTKTVCYGFFLTATVLNGERITVANRPALS